MAAGVTRVWRWRGRRFGRRPVVLVLVLATVAAVAVAFATSPSPPRRIMLATGPSGGMYDSFGQEYHHRLDRLGLQARTLSTNGSRDNLERLLRREVDVAFVQSGVGPLVPNAQERLRALAALYVEPLWVFHRLGPSVDSLSAFSGRRVSVGAPGSGTEAVARARLREHGIDTAVNLPPAEARGELEAGRLDAAFFVTSYRDPSVHALLRRPDIALLSFRREAAYARKVPGLQTVKLPEGVLDLRDNIPSRDTTLLGPTLEGVDLPVHEGAEVYLTQGESFLSRTVPYSVFRWWGLLKLLVLPLLVWLPLVRILPEISNWRADRRLSRLYGALRRQEAEIAQATTPQQLHEHLTALAALGATAESQAGKIAPHRHRDLYHWRLHVAMVRDEALSRLAQLEKEGETPTGVPLTWRSATGRRD